MAAVVLARMMTALERELEILRPDNSACKQCPTGGVHRGFTIKSSLTPEFRNFLRIERWPARMSCRYSPWQADVLYGLDLPAFLGDARFTLEKLLKVLTIFQKSDACRTNEHAAPPGALGNKTLCTDRSLES